MLSYEGNWHMTIDHIWQNIDNICCHYWQYMNTRRSLNGQGAGVTLRYSMRIYSTGFPFCFFSGFLAIFTLSSNNNNRYWWVILYIWMVVLFSKYFDRYNFLISFSGCFYIIQCSWFKLFSLIWWKYCGNNHLFKSQISKIAANGTM